MTFLSKSKIVYFLAVTAIFLFASLIPQKIGEDYSFNSSDVLSEIISSTGSEDINLKQEPLYLETISDLKHKLIDQKKDFLEVNLSLMKVRLYKKGEPVRIASILTIGDPQNWGGSAAGLYKILDGHKLSFSVVSDVYMPWALHYYGKYYIHGEPYYPGGRKLISSVSGGCIRLKDKDARDIYELSEINMPVLVIDKEKDHYLFENKKLFYLPEISAKSYLAVDLDSGYVFLERDSERELPIASLTKLMTAVVVSENVDLRKYIAVQEEMLKAYGSTKGLEKGKKFRVVELFYPLLIESSNDAAEVLAGYLGRAETIEKMNEKAKAILMQKTEFVDPHGFDRRNVSSARDLFQLTRYILDVRPLIFKITKGEEVPSFGGIHFDVKNLWNKNIFIYDKSFVGGKTGYIRQSDYNGIFVFKFMTEKKDTRNIVIIILGSKNLRSDTQKIYHWIWKNYSLSPVYDTIEK